MVGNFAGWPSDAIALVEGAIAAHGGLRQWQAITSIRLPFQNGSGSLLHLKGYGHTFPAPREFEIRPHERATILHNYPDERHRGYFVDGSVRIERVDSRAVVVDSKEHRRTFAGRAKYRRWSMLDALYFFGYALWHYHVLPFTLTDAHLLRILKRHGEPEGIDIVFPPQVETHCRRQQVYFAADGRIVRHDYVAEVIGAWARGAHFWEDYERSGGILIARRRRVVGRLGRHLTPLSVLRVQFGEPLVGHEPS